MNNLANVNFLQNCQLATQRDYSREFPLVQASQKFLFDVMCS